MAVQREIVDKDGNRLAVVQGGAGKSAVYGKTAEGEWVPLQVDAAGRAVLNVGEVSATIGVIEQGAAGEDPWPVQLNGSIAEGLSRRFIGINRVMVMGEIAAQTTETVHTYAYGADIEFLEFSTNVENAVSMELEAFEPDGITAGAIFILGSSADSAKPLTPLQLRAHKSALFELLVDDAGMYKIGLRRQTPVGNGFKVSIKNDSADTAYRYGLFIYYNKCAV